MTKIVPQAVAVAMLSALLTASTVAAQALPSPYIVNYRCRVGDVYSGSTYSGDLENFCIPATPNRQGLRCYHFETFTSSLGDMGIGLSILTRDELDPTQTAKEVCVFASTVTFGGDEAAAIPTVSTANVIGFDQDQSPLTFDNCATWLKVGKKFEMQSDNYRQPGPWIANDTLTCTLELQPKD